MLKELKRKLEKVKNNPVCEIEVLDTDDNKKYYVVVQHKEVLFATFDTSYLDYKKGRSSKEPTMVEEANSEWFNYYTDENVTKFFEFYTSAYKALNFKSTRTSLLRKYSHLKRPLGNIKYTVVNKNIESVFACGPLGDVYEVKIHLLDENIDLYVNTDVFSCSRYVTRKSAIDVEDDLEIIETINDFSKAKSSTYYDLYLELEKVIDDYAYYMQENERKEENN